MTDLNHLLMRNFVRYMVIPCSLGLAAMAAIVLPGPGDDLSMTRLLLGCSMLLLVPAGMGWPLLYLDKRRMQRKQ